MNKSILANTLMRKEASEASERIANQLTINQAKVEQISQEIRAFNPHAIMMVGRGSSDHAGVYAKYLVEIELGIPGIAAAPSVTTIYDKPLNLKGVLVIIVSQSGRSPDIIAQAEKAKQSGAFCIALLNDESAPLVEKVDHVIPLSVGEERSVAATKSYLATLAAIIQLVAYWKNDESLIKAVQTIPFALKQAANAESQITTDALDNVNNLVVLGRGLGYAVSKEIALKLKEVCSIHAEAFSSAEFLHGPVTLVEQRMTILDVFVNDESAVSHKDQVDDVEQRGGHIIHLHQVNYDLHPRIAALAVMQRFYLDIEALAVARGIDPDNPGGLKKVTETI